MLLVTCPHTRSETGNSFSDVSATSTPIRPAPHNVVVFQTMSSEARSRGDYVESKSDLDVFPMCPIDPGTEQGSGVHLHESATGAAKRIARSAARAATRTAGR